LHAVYSQGWSEYVGLSLSIGSLDLCVHSLWQFIDFILIITVDVSDLLECPLPMSCLLNVPGTVNLYDHVESVYYLDGVNFNPNIDSHIHAVRTACKGALGYAS